MIAMTTSNSIRVNPLFGRSTRMKGSGATYGNDMGEAGGN